MKLEHSESWMAVADPEKARMIWLRKLSLKFHCRWSSLLCPGFLLTGRSDSDRK